MRPNKQLFTAGCLALILATAASNALAQNYMFGRKDLPTVNPGGFGAVFIAEADFNGDGKPDLAVANQNSNVVSILLGRPDGTFQPAVNFATGRKPLQVIVGDFNKDGKLDLATANFNDGTVSILLGNGDGTFKPHVDFATSTGPGSVATGDFNGDGKLDLAVTGGLATGEVGILLGNGDGTFQAPKTFFSGGGFAQDVTIADFNGDGKLDLAVINFSTDTVGILLGKGDGTFQLPIDFVVGVEPTSVVTGDFNGDGKPDLAVANQGGTVSVLLNTGTGIFDPKTDYPLANKFQTSAPLLVAHDLDGDGVLDLVVTNSDTNKVSVFVGNGDGTFQPHRDYGAGSGAASAAVADFNGDGHPDLAVANFGSNTVSILLGDGHNTFSSRRDYSATGFGTPIPNSVALGDFNKDNALDMAVADAAQNLVSILLNKGDGTFLAPSFFSTGANPHGIVEGDFNGDGVLDLATANSTANTVSVLLGNGDGTFQNHFDSAIGSCSDPVSLASGDFNGDGNLDLAVACSNSQAIFIMLGNGNGGFSSTTFFTLGLFSPKWVTIGDFNGDGRLDLAVAATAFGSSEVFIALGNGDGTFKTPPLGNAIGLNVGISSVTTGDFNGDGKLDLAVANICSSSTSCSNGAVGILLGNGDGTFQPIVDYPAQADTIFAIAGDFNGDGKLDVAAANVGSQSVSILLGNGDGTLQTHLDYATRDCIFLAAGDLDNDNGLDLVAVNDLAGVVSVFSSTPVAALFPSSLTFAGQGVETPSLTRSVILNNPGTGNLNLSGILASGDFTETDNCGTSLKPGANCALSVTFTPTTKGTRPGAITINDNARGGPQLVSLSGVGLTPSATLSRTSLNFGNQPVGTTSTPLTLTLTNNGDAALTISSIATSAQFAQTNNCGSFVNPGAACTISVTFKPTSAGAQTGVLAAKDNAGEGEQDVALSGTGTAAATASSSAGPLTSSPGMAASTPSTAASNSMPPTSATSTVGGPAQMDNVVSASISGEISTQAEANIHQEAAQHGEAVATLSSQALPFGGQRLHTAGKVQTLTLTNTGNALLEIRGISTSAGDFTETNSCGASLAAQASCTIQVTLTPSKPGRLEGFLQIDAGNEDPRKVLLYGAGLEDREASTTTANHVGAKPARSQSK